MGTKGKQPAGWVVYLIATVTILLWGMSYIWIERLLALGLPVEFIVPVRIFVAGLILLVFNLVTRQSIRVRRKDIPKFLLLALCEPLVYFLCETYGIQFTESPTISALIVATNPIFSALVGLVIFREKVNWVNAAGILICLLGLTLVTRAHGEVGPMFWVGVALLFIAVFSEVAHISLTKSLSDGYSAGAIVMYQFLVGTVYFLPLFFTRGIRHFDLQLYFSWDVWGPMLMLAILCSCVAFSLWAVAIRHLGVAKSSIFLAMTPIATALWGLLLGDEVLVPCQWLGLAIACVGLVLTQKASARK